jgi:hypothetical protein
MKTITKILLIICCLAWTVSSDCFAGKLAQKGRMDRSRLNIGTYLLRPYATSEQHISDLAECGIDFVVCMQDDRKALDLFEKYGVGAIVTGILPGWWGGDGDNAGTFERTHPMSAYEEAAARFTDHPAIWGIDIGDEPSALDFPYYGKVFERVDELFPNQFPYLNLYPNYASIASNDGTQTVNQLGTRSYAEHISKYVTAVPSDYICYDFYVYTSTVPRAYDNLCIVADACRDSGRSMWIVLQVNSHKPELWITPNQLRFQAYTAMAFGAENIIWACYTAGWFHNQVLDGQGNKTEQYDKLKAVNAEIHRLGEPYMKYRRLSTAFVGFDGTEWLKDVDVSTVPLFNDGIFNDLRTTEGTPLVVGSMVNRVGKRQNAVMVCAADDPLDASPKEHTLVFKAPGRKIIVWGPEGRIQVKKDKEGCYRLPLPSNGALFIEAK